VKTFACDFSKWTSERLRRELIFHENDRGTENVDEEYRRMFLVHKITAELQRRGEHVEMSAHDQCSGAAGSRSAARAGRK